MVCKEQAGSELKSQIRTSPWRGPSLPSTIASCVFGQTLKLESDGTEEVRVTECPGGGGQSPP